MGIKSTYTISREVAVQVIIQKTLSADNKTLEELLEVFPESYFRNYIISDEPEDDYCIRSLSDF